MTIIPHRLALLSNRPPALAYIENYFRRLVIGVKADKPEQIIFLVSNVEDSPLAKSNHERSLFVIRKQYRLLLPVVLECQRIVLEDQLVRLGYFFNTPHACTQRGL